MALVLVVPLILLTGCVQGPKVSRFQDPIAIRQNDGTISIAVCRDVSPQKFLADFRNVPNGEDWKPFVKGEGEAAISAGTIIELTSLPDGLDYTVSNQPDFSPGTDFEVFLLPPEGQPGKLIALFTLDPAEVVPTDSWLHPDGSTTADPCPAE